MKKSEDDVWTIEFNSKNIGKLVNPRGHEMFWVKYDLVSEDTHKSILYDPENWDTDKFVFKNKSGRTATNAYSSGNVRESLQKSEIVMRGLQIEPNNEEIAKTQRKEKLQDWVQSILWAILFALVYLAYRQFT